jgi:hypothetical protein
VWGIPFILPHDSEDCKRRSLARILRLRSQPNSAAARLHIFMWRFSEWLLAEERSLVDPSVLDSYEQAFEQKLEELIQRTKAPDLRQAFEAMRSCPIKSMDGRCSRFVDYIMAALVKSGCHKTYEIEGSLQRIVFKMIGKTGERGLPHKGVFDFDESRPYNLRLGNPVQVVFKKYVSNEIRAISMNCIPSIRTIQRPGRLSIGQGSEDSGMVSPDKIPDRPQSHEPEMMGDLIELLRKHSTPNLHLVDLFYSILDKEGPGVQSTRFGTSQVATGKRMIIKIIEQYARDTQNWHMLRLLDRFRERFPKRFEEPEVPKRKAVVAARV